MVLARLSIGLFALALVSLQFVPSATQAFAEMRSIRIETIKSTTPNGKPAAALVVNGEIVAQLAKDQRSRTPARNISVAASLITMAYRDGTAEFSVQATDSTNRRYALFLNGRVLLVATDMEGKAWGAAPAELAKTWCDNLRQAWNMEAPAADPATDTTDIANHTAAIPVSTANGDSAGVLASMTTHTRTDPALLRLTVSNGHDVFTPPAHTRLTDSAVPAELTAQITGVRLGEGAARESIAQAILSYAGLPAGTALDWRVRSPAGVKLGLRPGQQSRLNVEYSASGTPSSTVDVVLENRALSLPRESMTFFSNEPEQVKQPQLLYYATLPARESGRLVFHHQNQGFGDLDLVARMVNSGNTAAAVHVIPGVADPDINTFYIGFKSAELFWYNLNAGAGYVLHIPANGQAYLAQQRLKPGYTGSGYLKLTNLGDANLRLETLSLAPGSKAPHSALNGVASTSYGVYQAPYFVITDTYETGDAWMYLRLGKECPESSTGGENLDGSYGMTHSFNIELHNPNDWPALVFVVLRGSAGEVKGQFFIDDEYVATPLVSGGEEQLLKEIPLSPGETKLLRIKALPLNGGFYPASIILRENRYP